MDTLALLEDGVAGGSRASNHGGSGSVLRVRCKCLQMRNKLSVHMNNYRGKLIMYVVDMYIYKPVLNTVE